MAYGRKDYFWGVAPEKSVFGELQASKTAVSGNVITAGAEVAFVTLLAPAGYIWHVTNILITAPLPGIHEGKIYIDAGLKGLFTFDSLINITLGEGGVITINPGERLYVYVKNLDTVDMYFRAFSSGFMQQVVR